MSDGFFGTRADIYIDIALIYFIVAPFAMRAAIQFAKAKNHIDHRNLQSFLLIIMIVSVVILEARIRFGGATDALSESLFYGSDLLVRIFLFHLTVALFTFISWIGLALLSWKRSNKILPGSFSQQHKTLGGWIYIGLWLTCITGIILYVMGFVF